MHENLNAFDSEFALNQFSGNQPLLLKMLDKFCEQYASFAADLPSRRTQDELSPLRQDVHTIKGVSGNLGMKALHQASRDFEEHMKDGIPSSNAVENYVTALKLTYLAIEQYESSINVQTPSATNSNADDTSSTKVSASQLLKAALLRNEFITQNQLDTWLDDLEIGEKALQELTIAIDDLDYEKAISLLE